MRIHWEERVHVPDVLADGTDLRPYKRLAAAVIDLALRDADDRPTSVNTIEARRFLSENSPLLSHWCRLANVHPAGLRELAGRRRWSENGPRPRRALQPVSGQDRRPARRSRRTSR